MRFEKCTASRGILFVRNGRWIVGGQVTNFRLGEVVENGEHQDAFRVDSRSFRAPLQGASPGQERHSQGVVGN
jgi:hypothetical protein